MTLLHSPLGGSDFVPKKKAQEFRGCAPLLPLPAERVGIGLGKQGVRAWASKQGAQRVRIGLGKQGRLGKQGVRAWASKGSGEEFFLNPLSDSCLFIYQWLRDNTEPEL